MENENQNSFLLSGSSGETPQVAAVVMSTAQPVNMSVAQDEAQQQVLVQETAAQSKPTDLTLAGASSSGQQGQAVYLTMGPGGQVLQILTSGVVSSQGGQTGLPQEGSVVAQVEGGATNYAQTVLTPAVPSTSISEQVPSPLFVTSNVVSSPLLLLQHTSQLQGQPKKGKKLVRRGQLPGGSKQTVRSLLQHKPSLPSHTETDVAPNVTVLSRDPSLSESLRLSAVGGTEAEDSKQPRLLSLLSHKTGSSKQDIEVQGVAVEDLDKILASRELVGHSDTQLASSKRPRILGSKQSGGSLSKTKSLIPILPAPQAQTLSITEPVLAVSSQLQHAQPVQSSQETVNIAADAHLMGGLQDTSPLIVQPDNLLPVSPEFDPNKQLISGSQVHFVQPVTENLLLAPAAPVLPEPDSVTAPPLETLPQISEGENSYPAAAPTSDNLFVAQESLVERSQLEGSTAESQESQEESTSHLTQSLDSEVHLVPAELLNPKSCEVFGEIKATVSRTLLDCIPGAKSTTLHLAKDNNLVLKEDGQGKLVIYGGFHDLLKVHSSLTSLSKEPSLKCQNISVKEPVAVAVQVETETEDKEIMCDLLKPQYSRSGRQLKWQTMDKGFDEDVKHPRDHKPKRPSKIGNKTKKISPSKLAKSKHKKKETDILAKVMEAVLKDTDSSKEMTDQPEENVEEIQEVKAEPAAVDPKQECEETTASLEDSSHSAPEDGPPNPEKSNKTAKKSFTTDSTSGTGKESEKENEDVVSSGTSDSKVILRQGVAKVLKSTEGIQLGKEQKRKKNYEKESPPKFFCTKCSFKTKRFSHFEKHMECHKEEVPLLKCNKCEFTTIRRSQLTKHKQSHSMVQYECPVCKYKSDSTELLTRHYKAKHKPDSTKHNKSVTVFHCPHCSYKTLRLYLYNRHLKVHSSIDTKGQDKLTKTYQCEMCPYKTLRKEHYRRHMANVHEERRPHLCDLCGKAFKRKDGLQQHRIMHLDKKSRKYPYQCPTCKKGFAAKGHLKDHMTIHTNVRAYLCEICGASFKTSSVQRKHVMTIHKNPRRFLCGKCQKRFNTKYALRRHLLTHNTPGMRTLSDDNKEEVLTADAGEATDVLQSFVQDDEDVKVHIVPQAIIEVGPVMEQSAEGVMDAGQQVVIATTSEALQGVQTMEQTYEQVVADGSGQQTLLQSNETSTALYYLTNFHSY